MTKNYYIDENDFIISEVPDKMSIANNTSRNKRTSHKNKQKSNLVRCQLCNALVERSQTQIQLHLESVHNIVNTKTE
jgi:hypothetical protein